jgi:hypothetical protein
VLLCGRGVGPAATSGSAVASISEQEGPGRSGPQGTAKARTEGVLNVGDEDRDSANREAMVDDEALRGIGGKEEHEQA